ncbi:MAG: chemotaxis protein CheA [Pelotomaculum sp.]|jgi:two-component system chemotaxis sensor kinase CheA
MSDYFGPDEKLEMVKFFVAESRDLLDEVEPQIIALERDAASSGKVDESIIGAIFRLFHSLKGSASFLGFQTVAKVTHEAETLLDIFRNGEAVLDSGHVDLLINTCDLIRNVVDAVELQFSDEGFEEDAATIIADLQKAIAAITDAQVADAAPGTELGDEAGSGQNSFGDDAEEGMGLSTNQEIVGRFVEEWTELLDDAEKALLALEKKPDDMESAEQALRDLQSIKGDAGFLGYGELEEVSRHAAALLGKIKAGSVLGDGVAVSFLLIAIDTLREGVRQIDNSMPLDLPGKQELCAYLQNIAGAAEDEAACAEETCEAPESPIGPATVEESSVQDTAKKEQPADNEKAAQAASKAEPGGTTERKAGQQQFIRVDLEKLDLLLDLVGELVISEAMVANSPDLKGLQLDRFEKAVLHLDKITRDIQEVAMSMRMIPLSGTFNKMVRLVRDLNQKLNKKISLEIIGEETEVDKTIIEQISDPLVHLIRNAVDHGIESAEERLALGKPEQGRIILEAKHSAGEVWITVEDDGRGLDREKIWQKGLERGLCSMEDGEMKDEEVWRLIFEPGFSTNDEVSSISGRGVGMDVVKRNIEKLRGRVDVRSVKGSGTLFAIRIPLTLAIIEGMVVKVAGNRYTIPINSIKESLQVAANQVTNVPGQVEVVRIRGDLLPVIRLHEFYRLSGERPPLTDGIMVVVENNDKKCCLFVDEIIGQQQIVIKGLSSYLGQVKSISGCAILGDGDVSLILDVDDLINAAEGLKK